MRLRRPHLSLYMALLAQGCENPFLVKRKEVMLCARINSRVTYHRCMLELAAWGYIRYVPSYDPGSKSQVRIIYLGEKPVVLSLIDRLSETGVEGEQPCS
ncbi:hypothetical protein [Pontibacter lucknowensis]|nr:hypothetical protein [Pontibacter lucknowensis]